MTRKWIEKGPRRSRFLTFVTLNTIPIHECCLLLQQPQDDAMNSASQLSPGAAACQQGRGDRWGTRRASFARLGNQIYDAIAVLLMIGIPVGVRWYTAVIDAVDAHAVNPGWIGFVF